MTLRRYLPFEKICLTAHSSFPRDFRRPNKPAARIIVRSRAKQIIRRDRAVASSSSRLPTSGRASPFCLARR